MNPRVKVRVHTEKIQVKRGLFHGISLERSAQLVNCAHG